MKTAVAITGLVLLLIAAFMFYIVFAGGTFLGFIITGTNATANFIAFLFVILALPIGSGLMFFGFAFKRPIYAAGAPQVVYKSSSIGPAALAVAVIAIIIAFASIGIMYSTVGSQSNELSTVSSQVNSLNTEVSSYLASVNTPPRDIAYKVDWCNKDNTGQDRFCPGTIVVNQGDTVQILIHTQRHRRAYFHVDYDSLLFPDQ